MRSGDGWILLLLVAGLLLWILTAFKRWLTAPPRLPFSVEVDEEIPVTDAVALLEEAGYEVMTVKRKIPIRVLLDDDQELESRLYVDHFVRVDEQIYVVKLARDRMPLEMTGSGIRERLLVYHLLYREAAGILYVDTERKRIHKIQFEVNG